MLDAGKATGLPAANQVSPAEARRNMLYAPRPDGPSIGTITTRFVAGVSGHIPLRIYAPVGQGPFGVLVYFHGGGWVLGDLTSHDATARRLCVLGNCIVVSVDYRLAPEHKYPAAVDDCTDALRWTRRNIAALGGDFDRIAVGGDSAGGNLAAAVALRTRDTGGPALRGQLLIYPVTDHYDAAWPSYTSNREGFGLTAEMMAWFWDQYLRDVGQRDDPYASPLRAPDKTGLPHAWVCTAEFDPLHDEGEAYAKALQAAGVPTQYQRYDGMHHGFFGWVGVLDVAGEANASAGAWLRRTLAA